MAIRNGDISDNFIAVIFDGICVGDNITNRAPAVIIGDLCHRQRGESPNLDSFSRRGAIARRLSFANCIVQRVGAAWRYGGHSN